MASETPPTLMSDLELAAERERLKELGMDELYVENGMYQSGLMGSWNRERQGKSQFYRDELERNNGLQVLGLAVFGIISIPLVIVMAIVLANLVE